MPSEAVKGLKKLEKRLSDPDWVQRPAGAFLRDWREDFKSEAIERAPDWRGGIKRSIRSSQDTAKFPLYARVFSDDPAARWMEYGTGLLSEDPQSAHRRYFPSPAGLRDWSEDHGLNPWAVAHGIWERGGLAPRHFFRDAERAADANFNAHMAAFARDIQRQAEAGA